MKTELMEQVSARIWSRWAIFTVVTLIGLTSGLSSFAAQEARSGGNNRLTNVFWVSGTTPTRNRQMFVNNMDYITSVDVLLTGWGNATSDYVTLKIGHACGGGTAWQYWGGATINLPNYGSIWATINISPGFNVTYGDYYIMEVSTQHSQLGANRDRYAYGRRVYSTETHHTDLLRYPAKKEDLIFLIRGTTDSSKAWYPEPTTNVACPTKCKSAYETENVSGGAKQYFNVLVQQFKTDNGFLWGTLQPGSFWGEDIEDLKGHVRDMVEGIAGDPVTPGLKYKYPWNNWVNNNKMNFYIALEEPTRDPELFRGFFYCANIDASIQVSDFINSSHVGSFFGWVPRWNPPSLKWGRDLANIGRVPHEVFGHGFGLADEYPGNSYYTTMAVYTNYALNNAAIGCSDTSSANWCSSYLNVEELKANMLNNSDPFYVCWTRPNSLSECEIDEDTGQPGVQAKCHYLAKFGAWLVPPYYGVNHCVPKTIVNYNIGVGCSCYIGGETAGPDMGVAQPHSTIMSSSHGCNPQEAPMGTCTDWEYVQPRNPGYHPAVEEELNTMMNCAFATTCAGYEYIGCANFQDKWTAVTNSRNIDFLRFANACETGGINRRR